MTRTVPRVAREPRRLTALEMASRQRTISVAEFFLKNRHLLGFDSAHKALVITVKEAVDNALDACEEAGILPEITVEIAHAGDKTLRVAVEDNGPGIVERQVARIFGKLLYGSKFHKLSQSRGQQGIGISAAGLYAQLTTGKPMRIVTRTSRRQQAWEMLLSIDTSKNRADLHKKQRVDWSKAHGTRVELELEAQTRAGPHSVLSYLKLSAVANPHATLRLIEPDGSEHVFERATRELPPQPVEIQPHPQGVELGRLIQMLKDTRHRNLGAFLRHEFSQVGSKTADEIIRRAGHSLTRRSYPRRVARRQAAALHRALGRVKTRAPSSDCVVPIGEPRIIEGLQKEVAADLYFAITRRPAVYRGNPFVVEVGVAYGRPDQAQLAVSSDGRIVKKKRSISGEDLLPRADEPVRVLRFANRVPLLFQQSACAITRAIVHTNWKSYGLSQPRGALPVAPMTILVHLASVWVPFTSESKEAIAAYPEIGREIDLALRECGRRLRSHISRRTRLVRELERRTRIEEFLPHLGDALVEILELPTVERDRVVEQLDQTLQRKRKVRA